MIPPTCENVLVRMPEASEEACCTIVIAVACKMPRSHLHVVVSWTGHSAARATQKSNVETVGLYRFPTKTDPGPGRYHRFACK